MISKQITMCDCNGTPHNCANYCGTSKDEKPMPDNDKDIHNGSKFFEMDTGILYLFDYENMIWHEIAFKK